MITFLSDDLTAPSESRICGGNEYIAPELQSWSSWTANSDKKLNVNKPRVTSRKTAFRKFFKIFYQFSRCH